MSHHIPEILKSTARELRNNMTDSEKELWKYLRGDTFGVRVLRQKIFYVYTEYNGFDRFIIPDFYIASKKLIIEVDGNIHKLPEVYKMDTVKEKLIKEKGFKILRITNEEIRNDIQKVIHKIKNKL